MSWMHPDARRWLTLIDGVLRRRGAATTEYRYECEERMVSAEVRVDHRWIRLTYLRETMRDPGMLVLCLVERNPTGDSSARLMTFFDGYWRLGVRSPRPDDPSPLRAAAAAHPIMQHNHYEGPPDLIISGPELHRVVEDFAHYVQTGSFDASR